MATAISRKHLLPAICGVLVAFVSTSDGAKLAAQPSTAERPAAAASCNAAVTVIGSTKACPVATVSFHISVPDCQHSSGTFGYTYLAVSQGLKPTVHRSANWIREQNQWDQWENVPLECDQGIYGLSIEGHPSCTCTAP